MVFLICVYENLFVIVILLQQLNYHLMARAMFEYSKTILKKVSFSSDLFYKELEKALQRLLPHEINELTIWLKEYTSNKPELYSCMSLIS